MWFTIYEKTRTHTVSTKNSRQLAAPRFVFVCGKDFSAGGEKSLRKITMSKLEAFKTRVMYSSEKRNVLCVISEKLYDPNLAEDLFSFEHMLAEISHKIIIVAESAGSFCELGAFVMDKDFRQKTIVVNEEKDEYRESFITLGPIKYLQEHNEKSVVLHNGIERIESCTGYLLRVKDIAEEDFSIELNNNSDDLSLQSLIYEFANIVELFQPLEYEDIIYLYQMIKNFESYKITNSAKHKIRTYKKVIELMCKMGLVVKQNGYYFINQNITCFNILFKLNRKEFNDYRFKYLSRVYKLQPERMIR